MRCSCAHSFFALSSCLVFLRTRFKFAFVTPQAFHVAIANDRVEEVIDITAGGRGDIGALDARDCGYGLYFLCLSPSFLSLCLDTHDLMIHNTHIHTHTHTHTNGDDCSLPVVVALVLSRRILTYAIWMRMCST